MTTPSSPYPAASPYPAGWYDDRTRPGWQRWWDGERWTTHMRHPLPPGQPSQPPPPNPAFQSRPAASTGGGSRWRRPQVLVPAVVGLLALVGIAAAVTPPPDTQVVAGSSSPSTSADEPATSAVTAATEPPIASASSTIEAPTTEAPPTQPPTTEAPTTTAAPTTTRPPTTKPPTTKRPTTAAPATTAALKPLASGCDPNYAGACVPIASDVDCAGGSGNGPAYVQGPVRVVGTDIYGLDGNDNDGIGCE